MTHLEEMCALAHGNPDPTWQWEPPGEPRTRVPTHKKWFKPNGHLVLDPWYPTGPLVRQHKPGMKEPEHAKLNKPDPDKPTTGELLSEKRLANISKLAVKLGVKFDDASCSDIPTKTRELQEIADQLITGPVVHREGTRPDDPDESFHFQDERIVTSPTVCGTYDIIRTSVQTERFYNRR